MEGVFRCRVCEQRRLVVDALEHMDDGREKVGSFVYSGDKLEANVGA